VKILSAAQLREWDEFTILHEPVASVDLMERAAGKCVNWLEEAGYKEHSFAIYCGKGNNGGDGLAIARMLAEKGIPVKVNILEFGHKGTGDFQVNLVRLQQHGSVEIRLIQSEEHFHPLLADEIIIDALLGSGINRPLEGLTANLVNYLNNSGCEIISIDIPSGLYTDSSSVGNCTIHAHHTLSFQCYKPALLVAENAKAIGEVHILDIGLHNDYYSSLDQAPDLIDDNLLISIFKKRNSFSHKGDFGHALIVAGSHGKMGAAVLAAKACLRSGVGLLSCHIPACGYEILQSTVPEAMVKTGSNHSAITKIDDDYTTYKAIGIGPGIDTGADTAEALKILLQNCKRPLVIDADALNIIAQHKDMLALLPPGSILTPHPKEFGRLFGKSGNDFERLNKASVMARSVNCVIVLKGHHSFITTPDGHSYFSSTGNAGMATAGSGDVLTGLLTGLLAQGYTAEQAAVLGVYLHGLAGDFAAKELSQEAMISSDIISQFGTAFKAVSGNRLQA
jgi:NAD(P)H-hydrate epimerase